MHIMDMQGAPFDVSLLHAYCLPGTSGLSPAVCFAARGSPVPALCPCLSAQCTLPVLQAERSGGWYHLMRRWVA